MGTTFLVTLISATTAVALWVGARAGLAPSTLWLAARRTMETVGLAVVLYAANLAATIVVVLGLRALGVFTSIYAGTDPMLLFASCVQAVLVQHWRYAGRNSGPSRRSEG